ncbi:MAG: ABC transporter transmembrane domain-containing protein [Planctomycetota bacterium]|jgi:ABC-type multidrug transport system fused ATPase/permease subunit
MKAFKRVFKYIWPQWPRIIAVVLSAVVVAALLSISFITIIPLLRVMMGKEGLHGWVDRKSCDWKYGVDFYVPETTDFADGSRGDIGYHLLVTDVRKDSLADAAGLRPIDKIVGVGEYLVSGEVEKIAFPTLLAELAATGKSKVTVQLRRPGRTGILELQLHTPEDKAYLDSLEFGIVGRAERAVKMAVVDRARWVVSFLPRGQGGAGRTKAVVYIILAIGVITVVRCLAKFYQDYMAQKVVQVGINNLREDAFEHVMDMPMGFFANERPSDTVSRIVRDTSVMGRAIRVMLGKALREPLNAAFMLGFAMLLSWQLTLIFLCAAPIVLSLLVVFGRKMKRATRKSLVASSQMLGKLQEAMSGLKVVKVYNQQDYERNVFSKINNRLLKQLLKISKVDAATTPVLEVLGMVAGGAALVVGVHWVAQGRMDGPGFFGLLILLGASAEAVRKTSGVWNKIQEANAAAERIFAVIDEPVEYERPGATDLAPLKERIEFIDVTFAYPGTYRPVLKGINLSVQAGHNVAIVGPNGSGKTTLANLIPRFYSPDSGRIFIDGKNIQDATLVSLRDQIGMVTQDVVTFNDTIAANIAYGKRNATRDEIITAAMRSFAHEFIDALPDGYDTIIGEQGAGLSGGQLQRIVIARVILKNPAILIFDEAMSQVDADSEAKIHKAIEEIMKDRTSFIIAHRFSTVITADVIVVMDDGQIIAQGQHDELIQRCALYRSLYETQLVRT